MKPEGFDDDENRVMCRTWMTLIHSLCPSSTVANLIYNEGYLSKRGRFNTAFKKRWFILDGDLMLRYFSEDTGTCKGFIDLKSITTVGAQGKEITLHTADRIWNFQADSEEDAQFWVVALSPILIKSFK